MIGKKNVSLPDKLIQHQIGWQTHQQLLVRALQNKLSMRHPVIEE
jgi:hypothetical protein